MKRLPIYLIILGLYLGLYRGNLALWNENEREPVHIFPYPVELYPQADQKALRQGIPIRDGGELHKLLEDYFS